MSKNIKLMIALGAAVVAGSSATATVFANLVTQNGSATSDSTYVFELGGSDSDGDGIPDGYSTWTICCCASTTGIDLS
jgi:hypothetical protein